MKNIVHSCMERRKNIKMPFFFSSTDYRYEISIKYQLGYFCNLSKKYRITSDKGRDILRLLAKKIVIMWNFPYQKK